MIPESAPPRDAVAICGPHRLGVVVEGNGLPVSLVMQTDLKSAEERGVGSLALAAARLPPSVLIRQTANIDELFSYNVLPAFAVGARGVILADDQRYPTGVLSLDEILRYVTEDQSSTPSHSALLRAFTDYLLSQDPALRMDLLDGILPLYAGRRHTEILVRCPQCGYLNRLEFLDPNALPTCQGPGESEHQLTLP